MSGKNQGSSRWMMPFWQGFLIQGSKWEVTKNVVENITVCPFILTLMHSEQPKLHRVLAILSATGLSFDHSVFRLNL